LVDQADLPDFAEKVIADNSLAAAVTNTLTARVRGKDGKTRYLEMLRFKLIESYDIREARREDIALGAPRRPLGNMDMELDVKPLQYFAFSLRNRLNVNAGIWKKPITTSIFTMGGEIPHPWDIVIPAIYWRKSTFP